MIEILKELHGLGWPGAVVLCVVVICSAVAIVVAIRAFRDEPTESEFAELFESKPGQPIELKNDTPPTKQKFPERGSPEYYAYMEQWLNQERVDNERQWRMLRKINDQIGDE